jgi:hypothetical protein
MKRECTNMQNTYFNVLLTLHRDIPVQYEPTGCTIYFQFISIINITCLEQAYCSFSGGTTFASQHKRMTYTSCCIYKVVHPYDEQ